MSWKLKKDSAGNDFLEDVKNGDETPIIPHRVLFPIEFKFDEKKQVPVLVDTDGRAFYLINAEAWQEGWPYSYSGVPGWEENPKSGHMMCFWFGQSGPTRILIWSAKDNFEDGLETAAEFLKDAKLVGFFVSDEELKELYKEAAEELKEDADKLDLTDDDEGEIYEKATADLTYTESGYISSEEWGDCGYVEENIVNAAYIISRLMYPDEDDPEWDGVGTPPKHLKLPKL